MMQYKIILKLLIIMGILIIGCDNSTEPKIDEKDPTENLVKIGEGTDQETLVEIYGIKNPYVGFDSLFIKLSNVSTKKVIENAEVTLMPMMDMGMMKHSAPFENPSSNQAVNTLFPCAVNFIMSGMWTLDVNFHNQDDNTNGKITLDLNVEPTSYVKKSMSSDSTKYFITLIKPHMPKVGMNDIEIVVHKKESMMSWPAVENLTITMEPSMPSMGHGSPNNINPTHTGTGHYVGKVNFTMTGDWLVEFDILQDGKMLVEAGFDIKVN